MNASDSIRIEGLKVLCHIGVPDEERVETQELRITVAMTPVRSFEEMEDDIAQTIDYAQVAEEIAAVAAERPRKLIETLAADVVTHIMNTQQVQRVWLRLEKRILPQTDCVVVELVREK